MIAHVFLKNKLISLDSIIPFCMQLHEKCGVEFNFIIFDKVSYETIINNNIVFGDLIARLGKITNLGSNGYKHKYIRKLYSILFLLRVWIRSIFMGDILLHFGLLDEKIFKGFARFIKRKKIILVESNSNGRYEQEFKNAILRSDNIDYYQFRLKNSNIKLTERQKSKYMRAGRLLGFDKEWNYFKHPNAHQSKKIIYSHPKKSSAWVDFLVNNSENYIAKEINEVKVKNKIVVFILGHIGHQNDERKELHFKKNFIDTLVAITTIIPENKIFIKPHTYADIELIERYISDANKVSEGNINYVITKLHPMVLASSAIFSVFNNNSTVIKEYFDVKLPVIQYIKAIPSDMIIDYFSPYPNFVIKDSFLDFLNAINEIMEDDSNYSQRFFTKFDYKFNCDNVSVIPQKLTPNN
jgi:hypothetical protein